MIIDLKLIDEKGVDISNTYSFDEEYLSKSQIKELNNVEVNGRVYLSVTEEIILDATVKGKMTILDAITGEPVDYPFDIEISSVLDDISEENYQKDAKRLDIKDILWQNIVLEVPISFTTKPDEERNLTGEGWEFVDEGKEKIDPRLAPLLERLEEEKGKE